MTVFVFSLMMGISQLAEKGIRSLETWALLGVALGALVLLLIRESRVRLPFVNLALFSKKDYISSIIPISLQAFTQFGLLVSLPVFLIDANGVEKHFAGLIIMTMTVMMAITSPIAGRMVDKYSSRWVCLVGTSLVALGAIIMFILRTNSLTPTDWMFLIISLFIFGTGFGSIQSGSTTAAIQASPKEIAGAATGFFHMIRFIMASLGSTVFGIMLASTSRNDLSGFYNSFILIIILSAITIPFTFWISARTKAIESISYVE